MIKFIVITAVLISLGAITANAVYAQQGDNTRRGWGFGDKNHVHVGPPGRSVSVNPNPND